MLRRLTVALALAAACAVSAASRAEGAFWVHHNVDRRVAAVSLATGLAASLAYWSALGWSWNKHSAGYKWGVWGVTTAGCMAASPIVAGLVVRERELTPREVAVMEGSCIVPILGGLIVNAIWDAHPEWDRLYGPAAGVIQTRHRIRARRTLRR